MTILHNSKGKQISCACKNTLKEVRESRDYVITDELVYVLQDVNGDGVNAGYIERYLSKEFAIWLFIRGKFDSDYVAILEFAESLSGSSWDFGSSSNKDWRNDSVLVSIVEDSQDFKQADLRPVRTMIRLKAFRNGNSGIRRTTERLRVSEVGGLLEDGEGRVPRGRSALGDHIEGDVVQSRPEIVGDVANDNAPSAVRGFTDSEVQGVLVGMRIVIGDGAVWVRKDERLDSLVEGSYVFPCSTYLEGDVIK